MRYNYSYETFSADQSEFDRKFTDYLNRKGSENWRVKHCSYCHGAEDSQTYAACMFEQKA